MLAIVASEDGYSEFVWNQHSESEVLTMKFKTKLMKLEI